MDIFDTRDLKLLSLKIEFAVLGVDIFLIGQGIKNIFLPLSVLIILILLFLQLINKRFLLLFPKFRWVERNTKTIDTYLLYLFLMLAVLSTLCGIFYPHIDFLSKSERIVKSLILPLILCLGIFTISLFLLFGKTFIRWRLVNNLKKSLSRTPFRQPKTYKCTQCNSSDSFITRSIIKWNMGQEELVCNKCGYIIMSKNLSIRLGEVVIDEDKLSFPNDFKIGLGSSDTSSLKHEEKDVLK